MPSRAKGKTSKREFSGLGRATHLELDVMLLAELNDIRTRLEWVQVDLLQGARIRYSLAKV
jgi:hypothetical protein